MKAQGPGPCATSRSVAYSAAMLNRRTTSADEALLRDEPRLLAGLAADDAATVEAFVRGTHRAVFALAAGLTRDPDLRKEWAHLALLRVLEDVREGRFALRHPGAFWSWFRKRAYFLVLDQCRIERRRAARRDAEVDPDSLPGPATKEAGDPAREFERAGLWADIEHCLERVASGEQRRALTLLLGQELAYDEIAAALDAPLNTVRTWIRRGRIALRECLARRWRLTEEEPGATFQ